MYYDIQSAEYCGGYKIKLTFADGKNGMVDFKKYIREGTVFEKFRNINFFKEFYINKDLYVLCWPGEIDIAPETLYAEATNTPLPQWVHI